MTLAHFKRGEGSRTVLLLHGFLGSGRNLTSLAQRLSEARSDLTIISADLPGHGTSPPMQPPYDLRALVEPVVAFADALPAPLAIVGHSMGGRVGVEAANQRPDRVAQVLLLDIAPGPIGDRNTDLETVARALLAAPASFASRTEARAALMQHGLSAALADWLLMNLANVGGNDGGGRLVWRIDRQALVDFGKASRGDDLWPHAEAIAQKLALAYGRRSGFVTHADRARLAELGVETHALDAGHYLHVDALDALVAWLAARLLR